MVVASQGPIPPTVRAMKRDPLVPVFVAFLTAILEAGLLAIGFDRWRSDTSTPKLPDRFPTRLFRSTRRSNACADLV
jgi:hypothetical protein